jgi:hypothetical protein
LDDTLKKIESFKRLPLFPVSVRNTFNTVFAASASKIGLLDADLLSELVSHYYRVQLLIELLDIFSANLTDIAQRDAQSDPVEIEEQTQLLRDIIDTMSQVLRSASDLADKLYSQ